MKLLEYRSNVMTIEEANALTGYANIPSVFYDTITGVYFLERQFASWMNTTKIAGINRTGYDRGTYCHEQVNLLIGFLYLPQTRFLKVTNKNEYQKKPRPCYVGEQIEAMIKQFNKGRLLHDKFYMPAPYEQAWDLEVQNAANVLLDRVEHFTSIKSAVGTVLDIERRYIETQHRQYEDEGVYYE
jgi:hypothetical protein